MAGFDPGADDPVADCVGYPPPLGQILLYYINNISIEDDRIVVRNLVFTAFLPLTAQAHHAYRVAYDFSKTETLEGAVIKLELVNPHARIHRSLSRRQCLVIFFHR